MRTQIAKVVQSGKKFLNFAPVDTANSPSSTALASDVLPELRTALALVIERTPTFTASAACETDKLFGKFADLLFSY